MSAAGESFRRGRRWRGWADAVLGVLAALAITVLVNHLAATRKVWRWTLTSSSQAALSPLESALYPHIEGMIRQYAAENPKLAPSFVDPIRNPEVAVLVRRQYQLGMKAGQVVIFEYRGQNRVVTEGELSVYNRDDMRGLVSGQQHEVRRSGFLGELRFTAALAALEDGGAVQAAYLTGHGEHSFESDEGTLGYSDFGRMLTGEKNLTLKPLNLLTNDFPDACRLVILAGPIRSLLPAEFMKLDRFLQRGGSAMILLSPYGVGGDNNLERWLYGRWSVVAPPTFVGDPKATLSSMGEDVVASAFGSHPIAAPMKRNAAQVYFPAPRFVLPAPTEKLPADAPKAEILVTTGETGMTKSDLKDGRYGFDPAHDQKDTRVPMAVAVEKGAVAGVAAGRGTARLVVVGDSVMFGNETLPKFDNHDFASLCVSWLLDRPQALVIGPKPIREYNIHLDAGRRRLVNATLLGFLPGGALLAAFLVWLRGRA
jgi:ABC-type uncharacterized transport system